MVRVRDGIELGQLEEPNVVDDPEASRLLAAGRPTDGELIRRFQADELDAFEAFFERYRGLIHRTAYGLTGDAGAAEEILQDTFIRAYRHRASLRTDVSPVPWLHRVALNLCYSRLGRRRLSVEPIGETAAQLREPGPEPAEHLEREELRQSIRRGVAALAPKHQGVVVLYYLHGMSLLETAEALGIALGTVKSRLHYALHALRGHLAAERPETSGGQVAGELAPQDAGTGGGR
jgi:RNA polymerase sigma-70 factor (ECF subfamily)